LLISGPDMQAEGREDVEKLGNHFRLAPSKMLVASSLGTFSSEKKRRDGPRLCVNRLGRSRGAIPPYLYREYEPEELPLYDSSSEGTGWSTGRDYGNYSTLFPQGMESFDLDHIGPAIDAFTEQFDFDSFLNNQLGPDWPVEANDWGVGFTSTWPALPPPDTPHVLHYSTIVESAPGEGDDDAGSVD